MGIEPTYAVWEAVVPMNVLFCTAACEFVLDQYRRSQGDGSNQLELSKGANHRSSDMSDYLQRYRNAMSGQTASIAACIHF